MVKVIPALLVAVILVLAVPGPCAVNEKKTAADHHLKLDRLVEHGSYGLTHEGRVVVSANSDTLLVPASIGKLLTSLLAIRTLGLDYRFKTEFYTDHDKNLYVKGFGDPFLVSEEIPEIMKALKSRGVTEISSIFIDGSSFAPSTVTDGAGDSLNPYDVSPGGLVVNFNTVNIRKDVAGGVHSAEPQTPLLPIMEKLGKKLPAGTHRINISNEPQNVFVLAGQLFRAFQSEAGITGNGQIIPKIIPVHADHVYTHLSSRNLNELLAGMLLYSNNFTANQLFLTVGATVSGYPATWEKARAAMDGFIAADPALAKSGITIVEGSGLSRKNMVSTRGMLRILELFNPYAELLPAESGALIKSGTLTGVYSYAGYLRKGTALDSFVIILNQKQNTRDRILEILKGIGGER